jgi:uncharacterized protein (DUF736 family)
MPPLPVVFQIISTCAAHFSTSNGLGLTEDRLRLDRLPATAAASFFPPRVPRFASRSKKAVGGRQALALCPSGAVRSSPVERPPSRSRLARPDWKGNTTMATIGTFTKTENGFTGTVKTLSLNVKSVKFVPAEGDSERGPDFRIFANATDFGAAWKKTARETQREYLSVKLDDPSFPAPIYASLVEAEDGQSHNLIWSRRNGD